MPSLETLTTKRLVLRRPTLQDAPEIFRNYASDPAVPKYLTWRPNQSVGETEAFLNTLDEEDLVWAITLDRAVVGMVGLEPGVGGLMMGYVLMRSLWSRGIMSEAAQAVLDHAFADPTVYRVWACVDVEHPSSGRVLEKIGMQKEAILRKFSTHPNVSDVPRDVYSYSRVRP